MKKLFFPAILLCAVVGFALRPPAGRKRIPVNLAPLASFPGQLEGFRSVTDNNQLLLRNPTDDDTLGLDRDYVDLAGTKINLYIVPQVIGSHAPPNCANYDGDSVLAFSRITLSGNPAISADQMTVQSADDNTRRSCLYYWKTAGGTLSTDPQHSISWMAWTWVQDHNGLQVRVCANGSDVASPESEKALQEFARATYPDAARLYPAVFGNDAKGRSERPGK